MTASAIDSTSTPAITDGLAGADPLPALDNRDAQAVVADLMTRRGGYLRAWNPGATGPGTALLQITGRMIQVLLQRLNQVPEKNKLAFLDILGIDLIAPSPARVPVVFVLQDNGGDGRAAAGTRVAAPPPPDATSQIYFETETSTGLAAAKLVQVVSLWPGRDQYTDHTPEFLAGEPFIPFELARLQNVPHALYLAHDTILMLAGKATVQVRFDLTVPSSVPIPMIWEYWDGQVWREFLAMSAACTDAPVSTDYDGTVGLTQSGRFVLRTDWAQTAKATVAGINATWIRARLTDSIPRDSGHVLPQVDQIKLTTLLDNSLTYGGQPGTSPLVHDKSQAALPPDLGSGRPPDKAFADATALDLTKPFFPFGQAPQPGATFAFAFDEAFGKPKAEVEIAVRVARSAQDALNDASVGVGNIDFIPHQLLWEYFDGYGWTILPGVTLLQHAPAGAFAASRLTRVNAGQVDLQIDCEVRFTIPDDIAKVKLNDQEAYWIRVTLISGTFGVSVSMPLNGANPPSFTYVISTPPAFQTFLIGYTWQNSAQLAPEHVLTYNDFGYADCTDQARWPGDPFAPFRVSADITPALFLGFDKPLPADRIGIFFDIDEDPQDIDGPALVWEYWDGFDWVRIPAADESRNLRVPGLLSFTAESDAASLNRFDRAAPPASGGGAAPDPGLWWIRGRLKEDGPPGAPAINGIYPNAAWATQQQTIVNDPIGVSDGRPNQVMNFRQFPVLPGETVEVCELSGPRANSEWRILVMEINDGDIAIVRQFETQLATEGPQTEFQIGVVRLVRDRKKRVTEAWVLWSSVDHFLDSGPNDRHYVPRRITGRIEFGDGISRGKCPPANALVRSPVYRTGGGSTGNVPARSISQVLGAIGATEQVFNPLPAGGGGDAETLAHLATRGPRTVRHRGRAVLPEDYEAMAMQTSAAIAAAHCLPCTDPAGFSAPGWVTLVIIPHSLDPQPVPSFGLREEVRLYIEARLPVGIVAGQTLYVIGPRYTAVDVEAVIAPIDPGNAGAVEQEVHDALLAFLHPLTGGPTGNGWEPGRRVYLSDVASVLTGLAGVDYVQTLTISLDAVPQGESVSIAPGNIVAAGAILIKVTGN